MQSLTNKGRIIGLGRVLVAAAFATLFAFVFVAFGPVGLNRLYHTADYPRGLWDPTKPITVLPLALLGIILGLYLGSIIFNYFERQFRRWESMDRGEKVTVFLGVLVGMLASGPFTLLFNVLPIPDKEIFLSIFFLALAFGLASIAIYTLQSMSDVLPWYKHRGPIERSGIKILDTNVIIDGRVYDVARSGFLEGEIYVPSFVLEELQHIADHHDSLKRQRGRRGLEVLKRIQAEFTIEVGKYDKYAPDVSEEVDARLVRMAKAIGGDIVTNDWNLNSVAKLQNVKILNINELALNLRPNVLPQEQLHISIIREGNQPGQGVGYLEDGTMVVVEGGRAHIGETRDVTVTQVIQTERGKMIFAEAEDVEDDGDYNNRRRRRP